MKGEPPEPLGPRARLVRLAGAWLLLFLGSPGVVDLPDRGVVGGALAIGGIALWAAAASRPGRRAFLVEWLAAGAGCAALMWWCAYVWGPSLLFIGVGQGAWLALGGAVLRRVARVLPLAWAAPVAWIGAETLRGWVPLPLSLGWLHLGHWAADWPLVVESARVWGVAGVGFAVAAWGGAVAAAHEARRALPLLHGATPSVVALVLALAVGPPQTVEGPRLLLVQPAIPQARKQKLDRAETLEEMIELTRRAVRAEVARGATPDLVCWGETMLLFGLVSDAVRADVENLEGDAYAGFVVDRELVESLDQFERGWIGAVLFGKRVPGLRTFEPVLPEGASFLSGAEVLSAVDGHVRRRNAVVIWDAQGERGPDAAKVRLVPGAESMYGLERIDAVRAFTDSVAGYVPDLAADEAVGVLPLETADGRAFRIAATVCFDNAFPELYTGPLRRGAVDFHLVVSNEAWYLESIEFDQMVAFSKLAAASSGRAVVRATNSGVSLVVGPDGAERARLRVDSTGRAVRQGGRDRSVAGWLGVTVPVPAAGPDAPATPYVRFETLWRALFVVLAAALAAAGAARGRRSASHASRNDGNRVPSAG